MGSQEPMIHGSQIEELPRSRFLRYLKKRPKAEWPFQEMVHGTVVGWPRENLETKSDGRSRGVQVSVVLQVQKIGVRNCGVQESRAGISKSHHIEWSSLASENVDGKKNKRTGKADQRRTLNGNDGWLYNYPR